MNNNYSELIKTKTPKIIKRLMSWCDKAKMLDFLGPLALRLYLAPVMWMAGVNKFTNFSDTTEWFGDNLNLPLPYLLVFMVAFIELLGSICLLFGFGIRLISIPLMIIMIGAAVTVHLQNGWLAIAGGSGIFANERTTGAIERLNRAKDLLKENGDYSWLTENGSFVVLNNGIEFATTYSIMLLVLFFIGAGHYLSLDYWLKRKFED